MQSSVWEADPVSSHPPVVISQVDVLLQDRVKGLPVHVDVGALDRLLAVEAVPDREGRERILAVIVVNAVAVRELELDAVTALLEIVGVPRVLGVLQPV